VIGLGEKAGEEAHTVTQNEMPAHTHQFMVNAGTGDRPLPQASVPARDAGGAARYGSHPAVIMHPGAIEAKGSSQPHENRMPFVVVHYIIALQGIFPSRN
jgi:microcystin-dependent protein